MTLKRKNQIHTLLKGIETGDEASVAVVSPDQYIQHNPQTHEGGEGLAALFKRLAKSSPRVNIVRVFSDGNFVFAHTEYDFDTSRVGFEIFRFEGDFTVEHWDNIQRREGPNASGLSMVDGPTEVTDLDRTESNRALVRSFVDGVLINRQLDKREYYIDDNCYLDHISNASVTQTYEKSHRVLAEGNFVLAVSEGSQNGDHSSFFDLFRLAGDKIVEHWNTTETVPPRSEWKNDNGKF